jgi:glucokinase
MSKEIVLAADLGGTNLRMAAVSRAGEILFRNGCETPRTGSPHAIVDAIVQSAKECKDSCSDHEIRVLAVSVPGTVKNGSVVTTPNLPMLDGFAFAAEIEKSFGIETVLENDANAAAVGENWLGAAKDFGNSVCLTLGTGIGGGVVLGGTILRGTNGAAGELGHVCVEANGAQCGCGSRGCIEQYASASAIVRMANELKEKFPDSVLHSNATAAEVFSAAKCGDALAGEVFREMGTYLGIAITDLINIFDPEAIVICGGASEGWELFAPHMHATIKQRAFGGAERPPIMRGTLGDNAGILGTARVAFDRLDSLSR